MSLATKRIPRFPRYFFWEFAETTMNTKKQPSAETLRDESRPSKPRLRWKKDEAATGLERIGARPRSSMLHDGATKYASVYAHYRLGRGGMTGWYWVATGPGIPHKNTCATAIETEDEAKKAALKYVKACLAGRVTA